MKLVDLVSWLWKPVKRRDQQLVVVRIQGADVKQLDEWNKTIQEQLHLKDHKLLVINHTAEIKVTSLPKELFEDDLLVGK